MNVHEYQAKALLRDYGVEGQIGLERSALHARGSISPGAGLPHGA